MRLIDADEYEKRIKPYDTEDDMDKALYNFAHYHLVTTPSAQPEQRWIPCSERLPEEHESIWAKAKGTDRWSEAMWEKQSDEVIVTELFEDDTTRTDTACTHDGEWYVKVKMVKRKIIAWMPLPEPYKERREEWLI